MAEEEEEPSPKLKYKKLRCQRTGQLFEVQEHEECPYCSGDSQSIENADTYKDFCEFKKGKDPINFGFPPDSSRNQSG